jgi:hypothetical protein
MLGDVTLHTCPRVSLFCVSYADHLLKAFWLNEMGDASDDSDASDSGSVSGEDSGPPSSTTSESSHAEVVERVLSYPEAKFDDDTLEWIASPQCHTHVAAQASFIDSFQESQDPFCDSFDIRFMQAVDVEPLFGHVSHEVAVPSDRARSEQDIAVLVPEAIDLASDRQPVQDGFAGERDEWKVESSSESDSDSESDKSSSAMAISSTNIFTNGAEAQFVPVVPPAVLEALLPAATPCAVAQRSSSAVAPAAAAACESRCPTNLVASGHDHRAHAQPPCRATSRSRSPQIMTPRSTPKSRRPCRLMVGEHSLVIPKPQALPDTEWWHDAVWNASLPARMSAPALAPSSEYLTELLCVGTCPDLFSYKATCRSRAFVVTMSPYRVLDRP